MIKGYVSIILNVLEMKVQMSVISTEEEKKASDLMMKTPTLVAGFAIISSTPQKEQED